MDRCYICFPEGKYKALTMSYDDGRSYDRKLISIFNKYGIKGTFHLNGGLFPDINPDNSLSKDRISMKEAKQLYIGHEVACHTLTHPTINRCPMEKVVQEIIEDRKVLESITMSPVQGLSYPNGSYSQEIKNILPSLGIAYSRVVGSSHCFSIPEDWYQWEATCHHNENLLEHGKAFKTLNNNQYLNLMYVWGHSFEFNEDNNWELIEDFCEMISLDDEIWYCTNIEFKRYMDAVKQVVFTIDGTFAYNPTLLTVHYSIGGEIVRFFQE